MGVNVAGFDPAFARMDPFADPHLAMALYSVGLALVLTVLVLAGVIADHYNKRERQSRHGGKWRQK
jgi:hypothetical protein